ncbi:MAG: prepilin-type N-terminal cleavage/methylation domain-containing protein [Deltaproteobacteria bacterium]|nr:prepilin-type N-terminal cleavage/methylation domain-containing protein [Deltaproteobacteria bacterium]
MTSKQFLHSSDKGFTLVELLVSTALGLLITGSIISVTMSSRNLYQYDIIRTRLNQELRSSLDVLGANVREAGENLSSTFDAIVLTNGTGINNSDELVLRRNLKDEVLKVCQPIAAASSTTSIYFADSSATAGCAYTDNTYAYSVWQTYRNEQDGVVRAFIYNQSTRQGEFFNYISETDTGTELIIQKSAGAWQYDYPVESSAVYLLEEWHFSLQEHDLGDNYLEVIENGDDANPLNIMYGLANFQVRAVMADGTVKNELDIADRWTDLQALDITVSAEDSWKDRNINKTITSRFFPRNVLSN